jgi:signal peptidase II
MAVMVGGVMAVAAIDQWVKQLVVRTCIQGAPHPLIPGILDVSYQQNHGVAFSAFPNASVYLLVALNVLVLVAFVMLMLPRLRLRSGRIALALVCGGAIGNIVDRIRLGYVIDYLDFHFWPVFNLADASIVIGVGIMLIVFLFYNHTSLLSAESDRL